MSDRTLVLMQKVNGKETEATYQLDKAVQKEGKVKAGDRAMVLYREEHGSKVVMHVEAAPAGKAKAAKRESKR